MKCHSDRDSACSSAIVADTDEVCHSDRDSACSSAIVADRVCMDSDSDMESVRTMFYKHVILQNYKVQVL
ncbi:hypothetical protein ACOMHN_024934 [Nucella lapillus]